jgi:molybdenum cofactor cytidylyltransferase
MHVAGILLAAGAGTRMGRNKMLLAIEGETLLRRAARGALSAGLDPVIVVLGHEADRAAAELAGLGCRTRVNAGYEKGVNTSLSAGVEAIPPEAEAAVVLLADMPFVGPDLIRAVLARYRETGAPVVTARYGEVTAPPTLYHRAVFPELVGGEGEGRGREVVRRHRAEIVCVDRSPGELADVDFAEDWERARTRLAAGGGHDR